MLKQNPFSVYDFLGYFVPGTFFCTIIVIVINFDFKEFKLEKGLIDFSYQEIAYYIIIFYIIGHLLSFISSITIERYSVWRLGHPPQYLLDFDKFTFWEVGELKIRYLFRWLNIALLLPIIIWDFFLGYLFKIDISIEKKIDDKSKKVIEKKIKLYLKKEIFKDEEETDIKKEKRLNWFNFIYNYVIENSDVYFQKIQNYVALFGFNRTITLVFNSITWVIFIQLIICLLEDKCFKFSIMALVILSSFLTYIFYINYNKFMRKYSIETIMGFIVIYKDD